MQGRRIFHVDGKEVYNQTVFPDRSFEVTFEVDSKVGKVSVVNVHKELAIYYTMVYDGREVVSTVFDKGKAPAGGRYCRNLHETPGLRVSAPRSL